MGTATCPLFRGCPLFTIGGSVCIMLPPVFWGGVPLISEKNNNVIFLCHHQLQQPLLSHPDLTVLGFPRTCDANRASPKTLYTVIFKHIGTGPRRSSLWWASYAWALAVSVERQVNKNKTRTVFFFVHVVGNCIHVLCLAVCASLRPWITVATYILLHTVCC